MGAQAAVTHVANLAELLSVIRKRRRIECSWLDCGRPAVWVVWVPQFGGSVTCSPHLERDLALPLFKEIAPIWPN